MNGSFRRYELLLPRKFNDGRQVPDDLIADTLIELEEQFGAVSSETQAIRGMWRHDDELFRDELLRIFVDTEDLPGSRAFFIDFKERLKDRFQQIDIWMTTYPIDVL
jgi:hypothetical protein